MDYLQCTNCGGNEPYSCRDMCYYYCGTCLPSDFGTPYCETCVEGMSKIESNRTCLDCSVEGRSVVNGTCVTCGLNCARCADLSGTFCTSCLAGSTLDETTHSCGDCPVGKYPIFDPNDITNFTCYDCMENCFNCTNGETCSSCKEGLYLQPNATCGPCESEGFATVGEYCFPCSPQCKTCTGVSPNECSSCFLWHYLTENNTCLPESKIKVIQNEFKADISQIYIQFDVPTVCGQASMSMADISEMMIYSNPKSEVVSALGSSTVALHQVSSLTAVQGYSISSVRLLDDSIRIKINADETIKDGTFVLMFKSLPAVVSAENKTRVLQEFYLVTENVNIVVTGLDKALGASQAAATAAVATASSLLLIVALPQAFVLMKLFESIDFYIYIDGDYPPNFSKFLAILSQGLMDLMPNIFESLADEEGIPVQPKFEEFGLKVHAFHNLGKHYTVAIIVTAIKLILWLAKLAFKRTKFRNVSSLINKKFGVEIFYGLVETFHLDLVLATLIHIVQRDKLNAGKIGLNYFVIVLLALQSLALLGLYIFMIYKVMRLSASYAKFVVLKVSEMKDEKWRFLLEDKVPRGNFFQKNFNVINLMKDILFTFLLFFAYSSPLAVIILIMIAHIGLSVVTLITPPFIIAWQNRLAKINAVLYVLLDIFLVATVATADGKSPAEKRYFFLGYPLIIVVLLMLLANVGFSMYYSFKDAIARFKKWREKRAKNKIASVNNQSLELEPKNPDESLEKLGKKEDGLKLSKLPKKEVKPEEVNNSNQRPQGIRKKVPNSSKFGKKLKTEALKRDEVGQSGLESANRKNLTKKLKVAAKLKL